MVACNRAAIPAGRTRSTAVGSFDPPEGTFSLLCVSKKTSKLLNDGSNKSMYVTLNTVDSEPLRHHQACPQRRSPRTAVSPRSCRTMVATSAGRCPQFKHLFRVEGTGELQVGVPPVRMLLPVLPSTETAASAFSRTICESSSALPTKLSSQDRASADLVH